MNISVLPIVSKLHNDVKINFETKKLLNDIENIGDYKFHLTEKDCF